MGSRARSLEALALILVIWVTARGAVLFWPTEERMGTPVKASRSASTPPVAIRPTGVAAPFFPTTYVVAANPPGRLAARAVQSKRMWAERQRVAESAMDGHFEAVPVAVMLHQTPTKTDTADLLDHVTPVKGTQRTIASVWMLWRPDNNRVTLGVAGQLGGSQAGARILVPLHPDGGLSLSLRMSTSFGQMRSRELAPGVSLKPFARVPFEVIAERRVLDGATAHDAFALLAAGGVSEEPLAHRWTLDAYAQTGIVGAKRRMAFADGAVAIRRPIADNVRLGAGLWGGIQPGLKRVDIGPTLSTRLAPADLALRLDIDWRFRVAGSSRPGSGVAVTVAKDF